MIAKERQPALSGRDRLLVNSRWRAKIYSNENNSGAFFMEMKSDAYGDLGVRALPNVLVEVSI